MRIAMLVLNDMSIDPRVERSAVHLTQAGHEVRVLALRSQAMPDAEERDGYRIERVADQTTASTRQLVTKVRQQRLRTKSLREAVIAFAPDVVHCHDANTLQPGGVAAQRVGAALVFDAHELYADSLTQYAFQRSWPVQRYWLWIERRWGVKADAVITVSDGAARILGERIGREVVVVANVPPLRDIVDRGLLRSELGIPDELTIVLYQAAISMGRAVEELVDAIADLPSAALVVQGRGAAEPLMRARVEERGISDRVWFMGMVPSEELFEYTCGADIGTCFVDGLTVNHQIGWANRLFMYFMAGISSAVTDLPGIGGLVREYEAGVTAEPRSVPAIREALHELIDDPDLRQRCGVGGRRAAETRFNWELESEKLSLIYERIAESRSR